MIAPTDFSTLFGTPPSTPSELGDPAILDTMGVGIDPTAGAFPSVPTLPDSARDFIEQLMQGVTVDPGPAAWETAASNAGAAPHMPGASASSRRAPGQSASDSHSAAPSGSRSPPPPLRLEIANSAQLQQQLARELGGEMNERVQQQFRQRVATPMARLEAQIRAMYR